ncbi:MAG: galactose mutarotase [Armatimonadetes bacterium]|nr:galactose mutarotase [Armatimonadota bacterium]
MKKASILPRTLALATLLLALPMLARADEGIVKAPFGILPNGKKVDVYTLANKNGLIAKVMTYGATLIELHAPDRKGQLADVVLGFDNLSAYVKGHPFFGSTVGRVANRIAKGQFTLEGKSYQLAINNAPNTLHGGNVGFDKVVWSAKPQKTTVGPSLVLSYVSPNGEENFPGTLKVTVSYTLTEDNTLRIDYQATTNKTTLVNLTNHSYFNLAGKGTTLDQTVRINANQYTPVDENVIPTGKLAPVAGTPFDFRVEHAIGERMSQIGNQPEGYDHNYVLIGRANDLKFAAKASDPASGRVLKVWTTEPGVQFYIGSFLDGTLTGKNGTTYEAYSGFCFEAQHFPDAIHHKNFPSIVLRPGQTYRQKTVYQFLAQ